MIKKLKCWSRFKNLFSRRMSLTVHSTHMTKTSDECTEYEVLAESNIVGDIEHNDFHFRIWEFANRTPGEKRKLNLKIVGKTVDHDELMRCIENASKNGRYTNLARPQEIVVLSSLFLRRRFTWPTLVRCGDKPLMLHLDQFDPCEALQTGYSNLDDLKESFQIWDRASEEFQHDYLRAARLYYFACNLMDKDVGASYLLFTSSIETLAKNHTLQNPPTLNEINLGLDKIIEDFVKDETVAENLRSAALRKEGFISRKFTEFALQNIEDKFWDEGTGPDYSRVKKEKIEQVLKNIYNQRSRTLHTGEPFPIYIYTCPRDRGEISFAPAISTEGKKWEKKDYIPYIHFMERLTNHILRTALRNHVEKLT